jgi:protein involved in temperature-dependent protein secretion
VPIEYRVDHERRLVLAKGHGTFSDRDAFGYQREVWSRPDVVGYGELIDMSEVRDIPLPDPRRVRDLAHLSAEMDGAASTGTKFAIYAPTDESYGLGRMYQTYRELQDHGRKEVGVFRTFDEALAFLGVERSPSDPR